MVWGRVGGNVNPHLYKLGAIPLSVVCSLYGISLSHCRQSEPNLGDLRLCSNVWISYCCLIGEVRHHWKWRIFYLIKDAVFLDSGSSTSDLCVYFFLCNVFWCSTVFKQWGLLMLEGSSCQIFSGHRSNVSNYCCDLVLAKDSWPFSVLCIDAETFDFRLRVTSKFLLIQLLHMKCDMSVCQFTGHCLYIPVLILISQCNFLMCMYTLLRFKETDKLWTVTK